MAVRHIFENGKRIKTERTLAARRKGKGLPLKREIVDEEKGTREDVTNLPEKELEEKLLIQKAVNKSRLDKKIAQAIEKDVPDKGMSKEETELRTEEGFGELQQKAVAQEEIERPFATLGTKKPETPVEAMGEIVQSVATGTTQTLDSIRALTTLGGRDTIQVKEARDRISLVNKNIENDIKNVAVGVGSANEVEKNILDAMASNQVIWSAAKKKGIRNAVYWLKGGGKDLEKEAGENDKMLKNLYRDLLIAKEQNRLGGA